MGLIDIISGHVNVAINKNEDLSEKRLAICKECPLYKETPMGPICNPRLYINENNKTDYSDRPKIGYRKGCGCALNRKTKLPAAKCIVMKW